jgi:single-strand DNA-binding protein
MNRVEITGRLVRKMEFACDKAGKPYITKSGGHVAKGTLADQHSKTKGDVSFFDFVCYGQVADIAVKQFEKGELVNVVGWIRQNKWRDQNGQNRTKIEIRVNEINPVFQKSRTAPKSETDIPAWADDDDGLFSDGGDEA